MRRSFASACYDEPEHLTSLTPQEATMSRLTGKLLYVRVTVVLVAAAATVNVTRAQGGSIHACVNQHSGEIKISDGGNCPPGSAPLQWDSGGSTGGSNAYYMSGGIVPGTSVARAFCPANTKVTGGGGISLAGSALSQNFPIADET